LLGNVDDVQFCHREILWRRGLVTGQQSVRHRTQKGGGCAAPKYRS
jgi:hypothetical protein